MPSERVSSLNNSFIPKQQNDMPQVQDITRSPKKNTCSQCNHMHTKATPEYWGITTAHRRPLDFFHSSRALQRNFQQKVSIDPPKKKFQCTYYT
jgi:hypothetical protein